MTDRIKGFTITLANDMREDDFEAIKTAVEMIKGVIHVEPSLVTSNDHMNRKIIQHEIMMKVYKIIEE